MRGFISAVLDDSLAHHHIPHAAARFTSREEGGTLVLEHEAHVLTRTYGRPGRIVARDEAGLHSGRYSRVTSETYVGLLLEIWQHPEIQQELGGTCRALSARVPEIIDTKTPRGGE